MRPDQAELERLLGRQRDVVVAEYIPGRPCLLRRDQLLVAARDYATVSDRARRWVDRLEPIAEVGVAKVHLRSSLKVDVGSLVSDLCEGAEGRALGVSPNHLVKAAPSEWGGPADDPFVVSQGPALEPAKGARDVTVAVLDTGISRHPWFSDCSWYAECGPDVAEQLDADGDRQLDTQAGHGTFVAGVVLQHAPASRLRIRRLLDSFGESDELELITTLESLYGWSRTVGENVDVINMSFGYYTFDDQPSPLVEAALGRFGPQTILVACAGNHGTDRPFWPAALDEVIGVGALDSDGSDPAPFSNRGPWVNACAIGERVTSSFIAFDGPMPATGDFDRDRFESYAQWSGTSFAAPTVAGAISAVAAAEDVPAPVAAARVLNPEGRRSFPGLGVVVADTGR